MTVLGKKVSAKVLFPAAAVIVFLAGMGITLALLQTPTEQRANVFEAGEVTIDLTEDGWDSWNPDDDPDGRTTRPGRTFTKDPAVANTGDTTAYVFLEVEVPKAEVRIVTEVPGQEDEVAAPAVTQLFTYEINGCEDEEKEEGWILLDDPDVSDDNFNSYLYGYSTPVEPGIGTRPLFEQAAFANVLEGDIPKAEELDIQITAYAVQSDYLEAGSSSTMKERLLAAFTIYLDEAGN